MRLMKMLGLVVMAAAATTAFIGVGTASAAHLVVVCLEDPAGLCPKGMLKEAGAGLPIVGKLEALPPEEKHTVLLGAFQVLCEESTIGGNITKSSPLHGVITELSISSCTPCSRVAALNLPYLVTFHHDLTGEHLWLMLVEQNSPTKPILIEVENCLTGNICSYTAQKIHLDVKNTAGGLPLVLSLKNVLTYEAGPKLFCGTEGKWDANYLVEILHGDIKEKGWLALDENEA